MRGYRYMLLGIFLMVSYPFGAFYGIGLPMVICGVLIFFSGFIYSFFNK
jgi:hypothetical protein